MSLFGAMMYGATSANRFLLVIGAICVIAFFMYIMFSQMYKKGWKNHEFDMAHNTNSSCLWGFVFALIGFLPAILMSLYTMIFPPFTATGDMAGNSYIVYLLNKSFLQGMYISIHQHIVPTVQGTNSLNAQCILHLISALPGIICCGVGYIIGYFRFHNDR
jgi:hypothetical protein